MNIYNTILERKRTKQKAFAILVDPDNIEQPALLDLIQLAVSCHVDYFFVGGSLIVKDHVGTVVKTIKARCKIPVILFPGSNMHIDAQADAILFLSLISGRNPDLLIGQQVIAAPILKRTPLEILSTGYMLVDGGRSTTVSYISNTTPLPADKPSIAACTAMAGEMLGMKIIYMDAGSGAEYPISRKMIGAVSRSIDIPLVVGGGINNVAKAQDAWEAGADIVVIGNAIETNKTLVIDIAERAHLINN
ncbi:MAG TPA: geranylgeranylglyceryl/heptaprenylglyceryl phosphate synthase [Cytophagales bacterium]|nr:geranylgeranylglyceryl/heptaprenylglyceryl phosphate synthase [Cytophagales bacterium]